MVIQRRVAETSAGRSGDDEVRLGGCWRMKAVEVRTPWGRTATAGEVV